MADGSRGFLGGDDKHKLWCHLPLLVQAGSKDSMEEVLRTLWRTRRTGLSASDRADVRGALQVQSDSELDALLVCLRILIRGCLAAAVGEGERGGGGGVVVDVEALIPEDEVSPELRRLLGLVLQKLLREWLEDVAKEKAEAAAAATATATAEVDAEPSHKANEVQDSNTSSGRPSPDAGGEQPPAAEDPTTGTVASQGA